MALTSDASDASKRHSPSRENLILSIFPIFLILSYLVLSYLILSYVRCLSLPFTTCPLDEPLRRAGLRLVLKVITSRSHKSTTWVPSPLTGLDVSALVEAACAGLVDLARAGNLTALDAKRLTSGSILQDCEVLRELPTECLVDLIRATRHVWTRHVSWALFTTEWMDSLAQLLRHIVGTCTDVQHAPSRIRVLEVAAGSGLLASAMGRRGIDWHCSDSVQVPELQSQQGSCEHKAALQCLTDLELGDPALAPDVVFWSWWSRNESQEAKAAGNISEERAVAEHCHRLGIPIVFVGEPRGGITGGTSYWDHAPWTTTRADVLLGAAVDVAQWPGYEDCTWVQSGASGTTLQCSTASVGDTKVWYTRV
jgi:hypothetical protein